MRNHTVTQSACQAFSENKFREGFFLSRVERHIIELVLPPGDQPSASKVIDIEMLLMTGGRERTAQEFRELLAKAGFRLTQVIPTKSPYCVVEAEVVK